MILYLLKTVLCSALFLLLYRALLSRERMYRFNRAYLLGALAFSLAIPLLTFTVVRESPVVPAYDIQIPVTAVFTDAVADIDDMPQTVVSLNTLLIAVYVVVTMFFFARFVSSLFAIRRRIGRSEIERRGRAVIVLVDEDIVPHSFLHYIFMNRADYRNGRIEHEVLVHEWVHVAQCHSVDKIVVEILLVFMWFNPALYLYKRCIYLNHEFLADDGVLSRFDDPASYQELLIHRFNGAGRYPVTSPFSFLTTKKRLIMMTKKTSRKRSLIKALATLPLLAAAVLVFSSRTVVYAQSPANTTTGDVMVFDQSEKPNWATSTATEADKARVLRVKTESLKPGSQVGLGEYVATVDSITINRNNTSSVRFIVTRKGVDNDRSVLKLSHPAKDMEELTFRLEDQTLKIIPNDKGFVSATIKRPTLVVESGGSLMRGAGTYTINLDTIQVVFTVTPSTKTKDHIVSMESMGVTETAGEIILNAGDETYRVYTADGEKRKASGPSVDGVVEISLEQILMRRASLEKGNASAGGSLTDGDVSEEEMLAGRIERLPGSGDTPVVMVNYDTAKEAVNHAYIVRAHDTAIINAANSPLIVIDGVPQDKPVDPEFSVANAGVDDFSGLIDIPPSDIESIEVLKDAAAVALWGDRGKNGVLMITTKNKGASATPKKQVAVAVSDKELETVRRQQREAEQHKDGAQSALAQTAAQRGQVRQVRQVRQVAQIVRDEGKEQPREMQRQLKVVQDTATAPRLEKVGDLEYYTAFAGQPEFTAPKFRAGESTDFLNYVMRNIKYPEEALKNKVSGRVVMEFIVNSKGDMVNIRQSPEQDAADPALLREIERVFSESPKWIPATKNGENVAVKMSIPIAFRLE